MTNKGFFFWGIMTDNEAEETWKVLHDHFQALAREDDDGGSEVIATEGKGASRK